MSDGTLEKQKGCTKNCTKNLVKIFLKMICMKKKTYMKKKTRKLQTSA